MARRRSASGRLPSKRKPLKSHARRRPFGGAGPTAQTRGSHRLQPYLILPCTSAVAADVASIIDATRATPDACALLVPPGWSWHTETTGTPPPSTTAWHNRSSPMSSDATSRCCWRMRLNWLSRLGADGVHLGWSDTLEAARDTARHGGCSAAMRCAAFRPAVPGTMPWCSRRRAPITSPLQPTRRPRASASSPGGQKSLKSGRCLRLRHARHRRSRARSRG